MLAALAISGLVAAVTAILVELVRKDGPKIIAALHGQSWASTPASGRPATIRFSQPDMAAVRVPAPAGLRAAA